MVSVVSSEPVYGMVCDLAARIIAKAEMGTHKQIWKVL